ncbi:MAG: 50S ribosomal protein L11 methyltransferase, partial [Burkholderiales bacterium]|nr:50S ribosomal protein L11 methyltransferase [Burkholderiales bacterium]
MTKNPDTEISQGERFAFGANWTRFLKTLDEVRIAKAEESLRQMLALQRLDGLRFLDVGSGSGLFSLAARRLGATVHSFDYDPQSVACTSELKRRYFPDDPQWLVEQGSVLDRPYLDQLGRFDIVYS